MLTSRKSRSSVGRTVGLLSAIAITLLLVLLALGVPRLVQEGIPYPPERSWLDG